MDRKDLEAKVLQAVACVMPEIDISKLINYSVDRRA